MTITPSLTMTMTMTMTMTDLRHKVLLHEALHQPLGQLAEGRTVRLGLLLHRLRRRLLRLGLLVLVPSFGLLQLHVLLGPPEGGGGGDGGSYYGSNDDAQRL